MKSKTGKRIFLALGCILLLLLAFGTWYVNDCYRADTDAIAAFSAGHDIMPQTLTETVTVYAPENPTAGLIFYPGGKVEFTAYAPLMQALAQEDVLCILLKMPLNLAVLDVDAAQGLRAEYPEVSRWYLGGHSLGGSMAASHIAGESGYDGLLLLASYSTADLSESGLQVLSIYGTGDGVLNGEKYQQYRSNLPQDTRELVIHGGNHAQFGSYGLQDGDGDAAISSADQWTLTAEAFSGLLN